MLTGFPHGGTVWSCVPLISRRSAIDVLLLYKAPVNALGASLACACSRQAGLFEHIVSNPLPESLQSPYSAKIVPTENWPLTAHTKVSAGSGKKQTAEQAATNAVHFASQTTQSQNPLRTAATAFGSNTRRPRPNEGGGIGSAMQTWMVMKTELKRVISRIIIMDKSLTGAQGLRR